MRVVMVLLCVLGGGAAAAGGFLLHRWMDGPAVAESSAGPAVAMPVAAETTRRPEFVLADLDGRARGIGEWDGKLLVVNFWATWCPPCVHEIPIFNRLQQRYEERGVQFLGIAIDDVDNIKGFMDEVGLDYPTLHGQADAMDVMRAYGNRLGGLPFTVLVDRGGNIVHRHAGPLDETSAEALITALVGS